MNYIINNDIKFRKEVEILFAYNVFTANLYCFKGNFRDALLNYINNNVDIENKDQMKYLIDNNILKEVDNEI